MKNVLRYLLYIFIGIILGIVIGFLILELNGDEDINILSLLNIRENDKSSSGLEIQSRTPDFSLYSIDGVQINLNDAVGTPVIINFWATWCAPCVIEMPLIQGRYNDHKSDLVVLAVNAGESKTSVSKFIQENDLTFTTLLDPTKHVQKLYQIRAYPTTYFIDKDGVIQAIHVGVLSENQLDKYLSEIGVIDG